jgi:hypothetical protein
MRISKHFTSLSSEQFTLPCTNAFTCNHLTTLLNPHDLSIYNFDFTVEPASTSAYISSIAVLYILAV